MPVPRSTEYVRADSADAAVELLSAAAREGSDARVLAGGYSLVPLLKDGDATPDRLVDVSGVDALDGVFRRDGEVRVGALTTHDRIAASAPVREHARALADATGSVGDFQAKHRGTIAGNLVIADPKYDAPAAFLALGGRVVARGPDGERTVGADEWFRGPGETALGPAELVTEVVVPDADRSGYVRTSAYSGYAVVGAAAAFETDGGAVETARVAVNGARPYPVRLPDVEAALAGADLSTLAGDRAAAAADAALGDADPETLLANDAAAGEYRLRLVRSYCRRALERAATDG